VLITTDVPNPAISVAGMVMYTGGEITNKVNPVTKIDKPIIKS
jgi:hypothetical protein